MERPVYYYTWLRGRPNCHPVHTPKNIGDIEKMKQNHATMLSWSMMGSGSISLPFLEDQIYQDIPAQFRYHGFVNEWEFNKLCLQNGITPFAVIYESQSWEIPVELNEDESVIMKMNYIPDDQNKGQFYGFREFTADTYPKLYPKKFRDYFPDGLVNSDGEQVTDLYEECCCRDMYGNPTHSHWVEVRDMPQLCRGTCRNNPVWRAYLKKSVEILVDAGVKAIQLDETETSLTSIGHGGCFCKDCMKLFRDWLLREQKEGTLPAKLQEMDLSAFDYGAYLRENGYTYTNDPRVTPYYDLYWRFQIETQNRYFREIVDHARDYARSSRGEELLISANFTNMHLLYYPSVNYVDRCTTELRRTVFRRHNWLRLAAGYSGALPVVIAESPYDAFIPNFVKLIERGKADDYYRIFMMEAAVHGLSMAMPYGAWMGNDTYDSFYPPYGAGDEVQEFLYQHDALFSKKSGAKVLVLYSYASYLERDFDSARGETLEYTDPEDLFSYQVKTTAEYELPFFNITQRFVDRDIAFDVLVTGDGGLVPDTLTEQDLAPYDMVVLADDDFMTGDQLKLLRNFAAEKKVYVCGRLAENEAAEAAGLLGMDNVIYAAGTEELLAAVERDHAKIRESSFTCGTEEGSVYVQKNVLEDTRVYHVLNYLYDREHNCTKPQDVELTVKEEISGITLYTLSGDVPEYSLEKTDCGAIRIILKQVPCYTAVVLS